MFSCSLVPVAMNHGGGGFLKLLNLRLDFVRGLLGLLEPRCGRIQGVFESIRNRLLESCSCSNRTARMIASPWTSRTSFPLITMAFDPFGRTPPCTIKDSFPTDTTSWSMSAPDVLSLREKVTSPEPF